MFLPPNQCWAKWTWLGVFAIWRPTWYFLVLREMGRTHFGITARMQQSSHINGEFGMHQSWQKCTKIPYYGCVIIRLCMENESNLRILWITKIPFAAFELDEPASKISIDIVLTLDGSHLTKHLEFVTTGFKLVDCLVKNPLTGNYDLDPNQEEKYLKIQSWQWCFPMKFCMGK